MTAVRICDLEYLYVYGNDEDKAKKQAVIDDRAALLTKLGIVFDDPTHIRGVILTDEQVLALILANHEVKVVRSIEVRGPVMDQISDTMAKFNMMAERLLAMPAVERSFNQKCEVHMPGQALATYNEVMLMSDSCSDELQGRIDEGWRMIAACPQPDQRRPDYILGRFNPDRDTRDHRNGARRG